MWIIYLILRVFIPSKELLIWGDEARHLTTAKNFYKLWNKQFYDTHPPLYSLLIKLFSKVIPDHKAGIMVSLLSSIGLYFICNNIFHNLGLFGNQWLIAIGFITFNYTFIYFSNRIFRYELIALLGTTTLLLFITNHPVWAGITWGLASLTCSFAGFRLFWVWFFWFIFGHAEIMNIVSVGIYWLIYNEWLLIKLKNYAGNNYYPSGLDGKIEPISKITWKQLISPMYFPFTYEYYGKKELGYNFRGWVKKIGGIFGLYKTNHEVLNKILGIINIVLIVFTIKGMLISPFYLSTITIALLYPSLYKRWLPRNSIIVIPLLGYFLAQGLPIMPVEWLFLAFGGTAAVFLWFNRCLLFPKPKWQGEAVATYLKALPKDGILCEGLIAYSMAYLTDKRIVVIPHTPNPQKAIYQTNLSIKEFNLHYVVFSELYKTELYLGYPAIEYIKLFKLINTIEEEGDTYYVFEILTDKPA